MEINQIKKAAASHVEEVINIRRHIHQHPELSFQEKNTGEYIVKLLTDWGVSHTSGWAGHGVVALLEGTASSSNGKKTIGLRADIDALPILEKNTVSYASKNKGVMHACGHDVHTSSLLGAIKILHEGRASWSGQIKCLFQPGEEKLPGGASILIKEGVLKSPDIEKMIGQHVHPPLEVGKVGFCAGEYMASADEIYVTVSGQGGHGALPHNVIDPVLIASHLVVALQQIVSRNANPLMPSVLTFGEIKSDGGATNVVPNQVFLKGTFRTFDEAWRFDAHDKMKKIATGIVEGMGGQCNFDVRVGYPSLYNDPKYTKKCKAAAVDYLGSENVVTLPKRTTAEDFAYYSHEVPSCFYRLGTGNTARGITSPVHTDTFNIDEDALEVSIGLMANLALVSLGR